MPAAWRIVKERHAAAAFDGEGARRFGGRWNSPGTAVVYVAETRALALLEVLVGLRSTRVLGTYVLIPVRFDDELVEEVAREGLPEGWRRSPPGPETRRAGDAWVAEARSAVLRVPSAVVPDESNFLLNPAHPDFGRIEIGEPEAFAVDPRLGTLGRELS